jgi:microcystin-dependent protein
MTDTLTTVLGFTKQTIGGNRNTWGNTLNTNFDSIEEAICGRLALSATGGTIATLTQAQARKRYIDVSGALVSDGTIIVPNASKDWIISNSTTGDFALLVKTATGTATNVPVGTSKQVFCDGNANVYRADVAEIGQMAFFGNTAVPAGWWECTGVTKSRAGQGIDLFAKTSTTWGVGNGATTFGLPDAYTAGKFLRSRTASVALGTAQSDQNKAHTHGLTAGSAAAGGVHSHTGTTDLGGADHTHVTAGNCTYSLACTIGSIANGGGGGGTISDVLVLGGTGASLPVSSGTISFSGTSGGANVYLHTHTFTTGSSSTHTHTLSGTTDSDGGTEARPTNLSAILCIKY